MAAETNVIKAEQLAKVREVDFVNRFTHTSLDKLMELLGVTRKQAVMEGTTIYSYTTTGTLQTASVAEGEVIPLSQYTIEKTPIATAGLFKARKAATAEAIEKSGYNNAIIETDNKLLHDVQKNVRKDMFAVLNGSIAGSATATGTNLQSALANAWGKLQVAFEDDTAESVYFINPEDAADYLASAQISTQNAFGLTYIEDFLGLGTVVINSGVTKGTFLATAKENIVMYYVPMNGDLSKVFDLTTDETGYIGINSGYANNERAQAESLVMCGIKFAPEYAAGVIKGTIAGE